MRFLNHTRLLFVAVCTVFPYSATAAPTPIISQISPNPACIGDTVTITGKNLTNGGRPNVPRFSWPGPGVYFGTGPLLVGAKLTSATNRKIVLNLNSVNFIHGASPVIVINSGNLLGKHTFSVVPLALEPTITFNPNNISPISGQLVNVVGTVTLNVPAPTGGISVNMNLSGYPVAPVPIPAGSITGTFPFEVPGNATPKTLAFAASYGTSAASGSLIIN